MHVKVISYNVKRVKDIAYIKYDSTLKLSLPLPVYLTSIRFMTNERVNREQWRALNVLKGLRW